ncbi:ATP-binding region ATPase domain protein [Gemmatirosa kalamazoonensis]|uniref:histidine kinase n=2 Tax=Gemmatirosa kalamazoonensis TaxID=861299 RepID=W0RDP5_9BACT|nr:ATP-binding region ATPase domain protein [Gemmatirosa kalamazoonensis]
MIVLGALAVAPLVTSARARQLRAPLSEGAEPALVRVNDLQATLAAELYAATDWSRGGDGPALGRYRDAVAAEGTDLASLATLVARIDATSAGDLSRVTAAVRRWHGPSSTQPPPTTDDPLGLAALDAAQRLETDLQRFADGRRRDLRSAIQLDVRMAAALVPMAVIGVALLAWTSWRMASLAYVAEERRERLAAASRSREALFRGVSHDLRNPLGAASAYLQLLLGTEVYGRLGEPQREAIARADRLVRSALQSTGDLLDLARADAGHLPVRGVPVALDVLVREVVDDHAAAAARAGLALSVVVDDGTDVERKWLELSTDPGRVRQVLTNLLSNAIKYTPRGGAVEVRVLRAEATRVAVEVRDTGPGIPPEHREAVFEEAMRLPGTHAVAPGAGIGLASARRVARALGGELTVSDGPAGGAAFTLWLEKRATTDA